MASNWWKYGICVFGGLGIGYAVGVKITKNRTEEDIEQKISNIREMYRNDRRAKVSKKEVKADAKQPPEMSAKTSIDTERLSERRDKALQAEKQYGKAFKPSEKPESKRVVVEEEQKEPDDWNDYIHVVSEIPEDSTYTQEVLRYYIDGILAYSVSGKKLTDEEIKHRIGEDTLKLLEEDTCNELFVRNDLYGIDYTIIFSYDKWSEVTKEEPYKAEL